MRNEERTTALLLKLASQVSPLVEFTSYMISYNWNVLVYQVPYYDQIQNAESKLDHVTASAKAHEYQGMPEQIRGHIALNGFTDKGNSKFLI